MKCIAVCLGIMGLLVGMYTCPIVAASSTTVPDDLTVLTITSYTKTGEFKQKSTWLYTYKVEVSNGGTEALSNVCAKVSSNSTSVRVVDPEVCFPDIPAGGRVASRGTFTLSVDKKSYTPPANLSWTYSSIHISASPSSLAMEKGAQVSLTYTVTLSTSAPKPYVVAFFQSVPEGVTTTTVPSGWTTNQSATWQFTEQVTGVNPTKTSLTARAIILNTIQQAKVTVPIYVAAPLPAIGTPAAWPTAIPVGTSPVRFTVSAPDRPANITLREQTMGDIATLYDNGANGDARANDGIYSGNATIRAEAEGVLSFRATSGGLTSDPCYLTVTSFPFGPAPADPAMILPDANGNKLVVNHIIVSFAPGTLPSRITEILDNDAVRGRVVGVLGVPGYYHVEVLTDTVSDLLSAVAALKTYPEVLTAGPDYVGDTSGGPLDPINDPSYGEQWAVRDIGANYSWRASRGQGVKVAVIDKGVDYNHTELSGRVILGTNYTVLEGDVNRQNPMDESSQSHGTHVAGIIASALDNTGIAGIAPEVQIVAIKACSDSIGCPAANVAHAITEAVTGANAAPIINLSLWIVRDPVCDADPQCENSVEQAIIGASPLALIVASAGNDGDGDPDGAGPLTGPPLWNPVYPAAYDEVNLRGIAVAASVSAEPTEDPTYNSNRIWKGSHYGPKVHLTAPGFAYYNGANKHIYALARVAMGSYARRYGSSQAAAHVSGVAALLMQVRSTWPRWSANPSEPTIRKQLLDTADAAPFKCPANPPNTTYCVANGKVNAKNAVPTEPVIVWSNPAPITYGTTLSATQLNAVAQDLYDDTPLDATVGTLSYSPPAGTVLNAGTHTLSVTFTPNDLTRYSVSTKTVEITVGQANQAALTLTVVPPTVTYGTTATLSTSGGSGTGAVTYNTGTSTGCSVTGNQLSVINAEGSCSVTATKAGDINYNATTSSPFTVALLKTEATVTLGNLTQTYTGSALTPTATTTPSGLAIVWSGVPQTEVGSYTVAATINDMNYQGSASGIFVIEAALAPPSNFHIVTISSSSVLLEWSAGTGLLGYRVYYRSGSTSFAGPYEAGTNTNYMLNGLMPGNTYQFSVTSYNASTEIASPEVETVMPYPGTLDPTFGTGGFVTHNSAAGGNGYDIGSSITFDQSGRILVAGYSSRAQYNDDMVIWCYESNGNLCNDFGNGGIVVHNSAAGGDSYDYGSSIVIDSSGRFFVTGSSTRDYNNDDMVIWCYESNGNLCNDFGNGGIVVHNSAAGGNGQDGGSSIILDPSGRILVVGESYSDPATQNPDMVIWCYESNGNLCNDFGNGGIVVHNSAAGGNGQDGGSSIILDPSGRILVAGYSSNATGYDDMVIWCYLPDGTLDNTFGTGGIVTHNSSIYGQSYDSGLSITVDPSGRILVAGRKGFLMGDMMIWCYDANGNLCSDFGTDGTVYYPSTYSWGYSITVDSSLRILVTGMTWPDTISYMDMIIWRFLPDGTLDNTFGTGGIVVHNNAAGGNFHDYGHFIAFDSLGRILVTGVSSRDEITQNGDMTIWRYFP